MTTEQLLKHFAEYVSVKCIGCDGKGQYEDWWSNTSTKGAVSISSAPSSRMVACKMCGGSGKVSEWHAKPGARSITL